MKFQIAGLRIGGIKGNFVNTARSRKNGLTLPITINMKIRKSCGEMIRKYMDI